MLTIKDMVAVMEAFDNGEKIEHRLVDVMGEDWHECTVPIWDWSMYEYRIKPKEKYRPYNDTEEFFEHISLDRPIWLKEKSTDRVALLTVYGENWVEINRYVYGMVELFNNFEYIDNSPVGVKV